MPMDREYSMTIDYEPDGKNISLAKRRRDIYRPGAYISKICDNALIISLFSYLIYI